VLTPHFISLPRSFTHTLQYVQFFLTNRSIYLLAFDVSDSNSVKRVGYWLKKVKTITTEKVAVFIVGTHADCCEQSVVDATLSSLKKTFPTIYNPEVKGFYAVSCKTRKGLSTLKKALKQAAHEQPVLNQPVPKCYRELANALDHEKRKQSYMSLEEFEVGCVYARVCTCTLIQTCVVCALYACSA
jgi:internalin A